MAYENVAFNLEKNVQITAITSGGSGDYNTENGSLEEYTTSFTILPTSQAQVHRTHSNKIKPTKTGEITSEEMTAMPSALEMEGISNHSMTQDEDDNELGQRNDITTTVKIESAHSSNYESSQIFFYIQIAFFAMWGCLARIGTDRLFGSTLAKIEDPGEIVNQSFFSNIFGSFVLGALNGSPMGQTRLAAVYKGLTTGFCGSFTTWSKWNQQLSLTLIGESTLDPYRSQILSISSWFVGFYSYIGSYCVGKDFGKDIGGKIGKHVSHNGPKHADWCVSFLLILAFIGFALGVAFDSTQLGKSMWLAVVFAPFGACIRAWLSQFKIDKFKLPLGTLLANILGAILLAGIHVINVRVVDSECEGVTVCWPSIVTFGVGTGFCACLTTISTFMSEIFKLRPDHPRFAYSYAILTVVLCQILCGIINGVNHTVNPVFSQSQSVFSNTTTR